MNLYDVPETQEHPIKFHLVSNMKIIYDYVIIIQMVYNEFLLG